MGIPALGSQTDPFALIGPIMQGYMNCIIRIKDPQTKTTSDYDPHTDTGGLPTPIIVWTGPAIVQRVRRPAVGATSAEWVASSPYSFQLPMTAPQFLVHKGMLIQVLDGGDDQALKELSFVVTVGLSSSHAPVRLMEAVAETVSVYARSGPIPIFEVVTPDSTNDGYLVP